MGLIKEVTFDVDVKATEGRGKRLHQIQEFRKTVKLRQSTDVDDTFLWEDGIKAVKVICNKDGYNRVKAIGQNPKQVKGKVMYSKEEFGEDVKVLVREVAQLGAAAVFVVTDPGIIVDIPVFVVKKTLINKMVAAKAVQVKLQCMSAAPSEESESEEGDFGTGDILVGTTETRERHQVNDDQTSIEMSASMTEHLLLPASSTKEKYSIVRSSVHSRSTTQLPLDKVLESSQVPLPSNLEVSIPQASIIKDAATEIATNTEITTKEIAFEIGGHCQGKAVPTLFHLKALLPRSVVVDTFFQTDLNIIMATCNKKRRKVVGVQNWRDVKGAVVYSRETDVSDVKVLVESLVKHSALMVFVTCNPGIVCNIPVFVLNQSQFNSLVQLATRGLRISIRPGKVEYVEGVHCIEKNEPRLDSLDSERVDQVRNIQLTFNITIRSRGLDGAIKICIKTQRSTMFPSSTSCDEYCLWGVRTQQAMWYEGDLLNKEKVRGRVIITNKSDMATIHSIARVAADHGAVALFAPIKPREYFMLPVFVLDEAEMRNVMQCFSAYVDMEPLLESSRAYTYADVTQRKQSTRKSVKDKTLLSKFAHGLSKITPFNYVPKVKSHLKNVLARSSNWSTEDDFQSFCEALKIVQRARLIPHHSTEELHQVSRELVDHMDQSNQVDILVLSYGIFLLSCYEEESNGYEFMDLRKPLGAAVRRLSADFKCAQLCRLVPVMGNRLPYDPVMQFKTYVSSRLQKMSNGKNRGKFALDDELLMKFVWMVFHHCGSNFDWRYLIPLIDPAQFPANEDCELARILGVVCFRSLGLRVQTSIDSFCNVLDKMKMGSTVPVVVMFEGDKEFLLPLLKSSFKMHNVNKCLDQFRFHDPNQSLCRKIDRWKERVVSKILAENGDNARDLVSLQKILESIDVEHSYYDLYRLHIAKLCAKILEPADGWRYSYYVYNMHLPSIQNVRKALTKDPLGSLLVSQDLFGPMKSYVHYSLSEYTHEKSNEDKIALIDDVYSSLVRVQDVDRRDISSFLSESTRRIIHSCRSDFFQLATDKPELFDDASDEDLVAIAEIAWEKTHIAGNISTLTKLPLSHKGGGVMLNICKKLCDILCEHFECIEKWSDFYNAVEPNANATLKSLLEKVFLHMIQKWNPDDFQKIVSLSPMCLQTIHAFLSTTQHCHKITTATRMLIVKTCTDWDQKYKGGKLPYDEIHGICGFYCDEKWKSIEGMIGMQLASNAQLQSTLDRILGLLSSINSHVHIEVRSSDEEGPVENMPLLKVFSKYGCDFQSGIVGEILLEWQDFLSKAVDVKKTFALEDIQHVVDCLQEFRVEYQSEISISHYMGGTDCTLFYNEIGFFQNWIPISIETFLEKVSGAKDNLLTLLSCNGEDPCTHIKEVFDFLREENRDLLKEIEKLSMCPELRVNESDLGNFHLLLALVAVSLPLKIFVECCQQLNFKFTTNDESFGRLLQVSKILDMSEGSQFSAEDACSIASQIMSTVTLPDDIEDTEVEASIKGLVPFFTGLGYLSSTSNVWTLVREMNWFGEEGRKRFNEEYMNVTNKFLFADSETYESNILDALDPVVRFISYLGSLLDESSFREFFQKSKDLDELLVTNLTSTKRNIQLVQENVSNIRDWFDSGVDDTLAVFSRFDQVWKTGQYIIRDNRLCLKYAASEKENDVLLRNQGLATFVQQLGFVQQENQNLSSQISLFIDMYQVLVDVVMKCAQAATTGYECNLLQGYFPFSVQNTMIDARVLLTTAAKMLEECDLWLQQIQSSTPLSLLYWTEDLRVIYDIVISIYNQDEFDEHLDMSVLLSKLAALIPKEMKRTIRKNIIEKTRECLVQFKDRSDARDHCWLEFISQFLEHWCLELIGTVQPKSPPRAENGGIFLHSLECDENMKPLMILSALLHVYKVGGVPNSYEVLDGMVPCNRIKMRTFLARVKAFPESSFAVLNVQDLPGDLQEYLVNFMSQTNQSYHNLHCIQLSDTILHSSPWVEQVIWNDRRLHQTDLSTVKSHIVDGLFIDKLVVVLGAPGSGKTRWIRTEMERLQDLQDETKINTLSLSIHEGTTVHSLVESMKKIPFSESSETLLHFSFLVTLKSGCENGLMKSLNHFFNMLLLTRSIYDHVSGETLFLEWQKYHIFVELQGIDVDTTQDSLSAIARDALSSSIPILAYCSEFQTPPENYYIEEKASRVCTYLRALYDGTIDRKFDPTPAGKQLMFVIDRSGSMAGSKMNVAIDNALKIFDSHVRIGDVFGMLLFDSYAHFEIPLQEVTEASIQSMRNKVDSCRRAGGGTEMFSALHTALMDLGRQANECDSWIICLTDGESGHSYREEFRRDLCASPSNLHVMLIGVNLHHQYQDYLRDLCAKFGSMQTQGAFFASQANVGSLNDAFQSVSASIPVSQTFELDGALTDEDCWALIREYLPDFVPEHDMMRKKFWIEFLYRRVKVFDGNEHFNYNETYDHLGSSLMSIMLYEAERLLSPQHNRNWKESNHEQLIYDFRKPDAPEFRLICTAPKLMSKESIDRYTSLDLPGFSIPTMEQIKTRECLDLYLSQALNIPLVDCENGPQRLFCIDENRFVLTLDFTMKILNMHERVACHVPCIIEGETGVSKTALTLMYSILMNSSLAEQARKDTENALKAVKEELKKQGFMSDDISDHENPLDAIRAALVDATDGTKTSSSQIGNELHNLLLQHCDKRSCIFKSVPVNLSTDVGSIFQLLQWVSESNLEQTFFELKVDASLEESDIRDFFIDVCNIAKKVASSGAVVVVFLDEFNTSSVMGLFKEIIIDRSFCGEYLESNVAVVAACNPAGRQSLSAGLSRESDLAKEWASGHYQVNKLPMSMVSLKWNYGALNPEQEKEFVWRRIEMLSDSIPFHLVGELTEIITTSQEAIRSFAAKDIYSGLERISLSGENHDYIKKDEAANRARSVVSLRDIQRVFNLFRFFTVDFPVTRGNSSKHFRHSMLLTIAVVYYFKLDRESRISFLCEISTALKNPNLMDEFLTLLDQSMTAVVEETVIPAGIALTDGLKENIFMILVCSMSYTPLVIIGPPGSSKTLSVNILDFNTNGEESPSKWYRQLPRLSTYHYQCSKTSTSKEVASVFDKAIQRQLKVDPQKHKCLVFMDEAGLPEEEKESLKVLHYYLEGHMSSKASVAFVAITNHVLDAAKSNRCVSLLRQEPDEGEMSQVAEGVLFSAGKKSQRHTLLVRIGDKTVPGVEFASSLCSAYKALLNLEGYGFETFYGLRDFIYFLQHVRQACEIDGVFLTISQDVVVKALERNFNGISSKDFKVLLHTFLQECAMVSKDEIILRDTIDVVRSALKPECQSKARYALVIDESDDDSIMRILQSEGLLQASNRCLFKLSNMPENMEMERMNLVSRVKFAAQQGRDTIILSQTDSVNESFYDLFNQNFRRVPDRSGEERLYANIAVGGISRRSRVSQSFRCVVHVRSTDLENAPAPFLNRFEKYRLSIEELLCYKLGKSPFLCRIVTRARKQISIFSSVISLCGFVQGQTVETIFLDLFKQAPILHQQHVDMKATDFFGNSFSDYIGTFSKNIIGINVSLEELEQLYKYGLQFLPLHLADILQELIKKEELSNRHNILEAFNECVFHKPQGGLANLIDRLIEMLVTRIILTRLLQLASPEEMFKKRDSLPLDLIDEYFQQEHFSLKPFIQSISQSQVTDSKILKCIVHTRSNGQVMGIPTVRPGEKQPQNLSFVQTYIHQHPECVLIEHLNSLKNEASLRSAIATWSNDDSADLLVVVVDMSDQVCTERVNFLRCCIDQVVADKKKTFISILHYPTSAFSANKFYPALFFDDWKHTYLDNIGDKEGLSCDMKNLVRKTCHNKIDEQFDIGKMTQKIMTEAIKSVANMGIIYTEQLTLERSDSIAIFQAKCEFLSSILSTKIEETYMKDFLTSQFIGIWSNENLSRVLHRATWSLQNGTSQLGLTSCLKSIMQDVMGTFMLNILSQGNEWKNFDLLLDSFDQRQETDHLFLSILSLLPLLPFEEMLLHKTDSTKKQKQLPCTQNLNAKFPFFSLINSLLDEVVELVYQNIPQNKDTSSVIGACTVGYLLQKAMGLLEERCNENFGKIALETITRVSNAENLYHSYLEQFVTWILSCSSTSSAAHWFKDKLRAEGIQNPTNKCNLLLIHITARKYEIEVMRLKSFCNRVPHWDSTWETGKNNNSAFAFDGSGFIDATTNWFVANIDELTVSEVNGTWMDSFSMFKHMISDVLEDETMTSSNVVRNLRILSFLYTLRVHEDCPSHTVEACIRSIYDNEKSAFLSGLDTNMDTLMELFDATGQSEECKVQFMKHLLQQFFSPQWLSKIDMLWDDDLIFMTKYLTQVGDKALLLKLVRNACTYGAVSTSMHGNKDQIYDYALNLSLSRLKVVDSLLHCTDLSVFSADGSREGVPHFIPQFAQSFDRFYTTKDLPLANNNDSLSVFFLNYENSFSGILPEAIFQIVLEKIIMLTEGQTSDQLLLAFMKDVHDECNLTRQEQTRLRRIGTYASDQSGSNPHTGSALGVMIIESRLICFLLRVAYEMARGFPVPALEGSYSDKGKMVLRNIMCIPNARFQEIFMLHIVNVGGESRLRGLLCDERSLLGMLDWTEEWRGGLPMTMRGIEGALKTAEHTLREAELEEQQKSTEMRLCPHCGQPFLVLAANCGQFVCGRANTHSTPINGPMGCGNQFRLAQAQYYNIDQARLAPLRNAVSEEMEKLQRHQKMSRVWSWMREAKLPILSSTMTKDHDFFTPLSTVVATIGRDSDIVRHVAESKEKANSFQMLPPLIELYAWLHSTFSSIISPEQASSMRIGDIMKKELLCKRFDSIHVDHLLFVWESVRDSLNDHLIFCDHKVNWNCETLEIPFKKIESASIMMLLSAFQHPTDGCDYLFIIINQIVGQFNEFMRQIYTDQQTSMDSQSIHPRSLLSRSPAGLSLKALHFISSPNLSTMVEGFRIHLEDNYDVPGLDKAILDELSRCQFIIGNPLSELRSQFRFREDLSLQTIDVSKAGLQSSAGTYFVHHQDLQLFEDCQRVMTEKRFEPNNELKQTFMAKFHQLDYEGLRSVLTGILNTANTFSFVANETLATHVSNEYSLHDLGFPYLSESQAQLIVTLNSNQLAELANHVGYQLASEAYNFIMLPMSMNSEISCTERDKLLANMEELVNMNGKEEALRYLQEFRNDILYLYQNQIRDHCASSNDGMKHFLEMSNFCDDSDAIFAALPDSITVRNYIPLQQELHQLTLQMMTGNTILRTNKENAKLEPRNEFSNPSRGKCWLFQPIHSSIDDGIASDEDVSMNSARDACDELWFEGGMVYVGHNENDSDDIDDEGLSTSSQVQHFGCRSFRDGSEYDKDVSFSSSFDQHYNGSRNNCESMSIGEDDDISTASVVDGGQYTIPKDIFEVIATDSSDSSSDLVGGFIRDKSADQCVDTIVPGYKMTSKYDTSLRRQDESKCVDNVQDEGPFDIFDDRSTVQETTQEETGKKPPQAGSPTSKQIFADMNKSVSEGAVILKAKNIIKQFLEEPSEERLFVTMDEMEQHPGGTLAMVQACIHAGISCNDDERNAIITIISTLFTNQKITSSDITEPLGDIFASHCSHALEYVGDIIAEFVHIGVLDATWLCLQFEKLEDASSCPSFPSSTTVPHDQMQYLIPQILEQCIKSFIRRFDVQEARVHFASDSNRLMLAGLLGREKWKEMAKSTGLM